MAYEENAVPCASNDEASWIMSAVPDVIDAETGEVIVASTSVGRDIDDYDDDFVIDASTIPCLSGVEPTSVGNPAATSPPPTTRPTTSMTAMTSGTKTEETTASSATEGSSSSSSRSETKSSFYGCDYDDSDGDVYGDASSSSSSLPSDATKLNVVYDYELHAASSSLDDDALSEFENIIAYDMATKYGLIDCSATTTRRRRRLLRSHLRSVEVEGDGGRLIALDGLPTDESMANAYSCTVSSSANCTPMRGYMTAWLPSSSSNADAANDAASRIEAELLTYIEDGMRSDSFTTDEVIKVVYVGERTANAPSPSGGNDDYSDVDAVVESANMETKDNNDDGSNGRRLVAGGVTLFVLAIVLAALLVMYNRRRKRRHYSDGPKSEDASKSIPPPLVDGGVASRDPDDVQLLPSNDKLDMRSVHSEDYESSTDTENYSNRDEYYDESATEGEDDEWTRKYGAIYGGDMKCDAGTTRTDTIRRSPTEDYSDDKAIAGVTRYRGDGRTSRSSDLAAMGMASMLVTQSRE